MPRRLVIPILLYHSIDPSRSVISISPQRFEAQMGDLYRRGFRTVAPSQLVGEATAIPAVGDRRFVITFDDALASVIHCAKPILDRLGFAASVAVVTSRVGQNNQWAGQPKGIPTEDVMSWDDLAALRGSGWEMINHTHWHSRLTTLSDDALDEEVDTASRLMKDHLGIQPSVLAYPYGESSRLIESRLQSRFDMALVVENRLAEFPSNTMRVPRIDGTYIMPRMPSARPGTSGFPAYLGLRRMMRTIRFRRNDESGMAPRSTQGAD